jgi:hypothetical protein
MQKQKMTRDEVVRGINDMIRLRASRSPSINEMEAWKDFILDATGVPELLPFDAFEAASRAYRNAHLNEDAPGPLEAAIKAYLTVIANPAPKPEMKPCPFCQRPLSAKTTINPMAKCDTPKCWMSARQIGIPMDDPEQVRAWNNREEIF